MGMRTDAMEWAVKLGAPGEAADTTVKRAEAFLAFLRGGAKAEPAAKGGNGESDNFARTGAGGGGTRWALY